MMNKIFSKLGYMIEKSPFKVLFASLTVVALLITGALKVDMATGNETLVKTDSDAYISNFEMEEEFGGDAIIVLLKGDQANLLRQENVEKMWNVEERLKYNEDIYSFLSPASIVHQMTDKQDEKMKENFPQITDGLGEMSEKLVEIGTELSTKELPDPTEIDGKLDDLIAKMDPDRLIVDMLQQQDAEMAKMNQDVAQMSSGLSEMGKQLTAISANLSGKEVPDPQEIEQKLDRIMESMEPELSQQAMADVQATQLAAMKKELGQMKESLSGALSPEEFQTMAAGFATMGSNLQEISAGLAELPEKLGEMTASLQDPSVIFTGVMDEVEAEVAEMKGNLTGGIDPEELKTMADGFITMGENLGNLSETLETFNEKLGMLAATVPHNQAELDFILYDEDDELKEIFSDTVIDEEHVMMMIKLEGNIEDTAKDIVYQEVSQAMEAEEFEEDEIEYLISGKPVLDASLREEMKSNMQFMVVAAAIVMVLVLFLVFKVRWSILSMGIILIAVIATLGLMGHLSVSMTMVSMAVFPILIGLGIDFSIQFHNRYEEELSVTTALTQTGKAIAMAVLASMLGFISLYVSPVPMIQDFGKMLTIGVVISFLASIFLLMPILKIRDLYNPAANHPKSGGNGNPDAEDEGGILGRILGKTTKWVSQFAPLVVVVAIVLAGLGLFADSKVGVQTDIETFMPQDMEALEDIRYVRDVVGSTDQIIIYLEDEHILSEENVTWIQERVKEIEMNYDGEIEDVKSFDNLVTNLSDNDELTYEEYVDVVADLPESMRSMFVNDELTKGAIILNIKHMSTETLEDFVDSLNEDLADAPMELKVTGKSVLDVAMVEGLTGGRMKMTILGITLVFLGLFLVYRNAIKALIPVLPVILIVGMSGGVMYLLGFSYTPITATLGALILGMGTETTLMVLERYVEERESGKTKADALDITISRIGKATLSTEFTTMGGFAVLMFSNFVILKDFGIMTVINVTLVMISTFVVLPAVIWIFDRFIIKE